MTQLKNENYYLIKTRRLQHSSNPIYWKYSAVNVSEIEVFHGECSEMKEIIYLFYIREIA